MSVTSGTWWEILKPVVWVIGIIVGIVVIGLIWLAVKTEAGDLKCVTIKFKNDSELKLKTQWFVNSCDTTWKQTMFDDDIPKGAKVDSIIFDIHSFRDSTEDIRYTSYYFTVRCRILLFPPEIRKEPVIKSGYYRYHADGHVTISDSLVVADTTEGEALLWYEETR